MAKRIDGAIAIDMVCKAALQQRSYVLKDTIKDKNASGDVIPSLVRTLQEADVISLFFSKQNIHD